MAVAGRPNVGKSTLVNAVAGTKVAVVSDKPQTTRRAIRGIVSGERGGERYQLVLVDLPGVQRPRDALTERMQRRVERALSDCDAALFVLNGPEGIGPGDRFLARALRSTSVPVLVVVNKVDLLQGASTAQALFSAARLEDAGLKVQGVLPVSARTGAGIGPLTQTLVEMLPDGPLYYPEDVSTDQPREIALAELVREQALARTREEVPHSIEVQVEEISSRADLTVVRAVIWVEASSQKGILIGAGGAMIRDIGTAARGEIERRLGEHVHLDLTVKVRKGWRRDDALLDRLGIES